MEPEYFVFVKGFQHPEAQLWNDDVRTGTGELKPHLFIKRLEPDERRLNLKTLERRYKNVLV